MIRVLFVDDDPSLLSGLRRMLRDRRGRWQMEFVESGDEALERMRQNPFDVVVTDMRMPVWDGAELLKKVREDFPGTIRIILSGQSDQASIFRAVGATHQFLAKPCDAESIRNALDRVESVKRILTQPSLQNVVSHVTTLPSLPSTYSELVSILNEDDVSVHEIGELVATDVSMTTKLLQLLNSSFFGLPNRIECPLTAVKLLGVKLIKPLILSTGVFAQFEGKSVDGFNLQRFMDHSIAVSNLANQIALVEYGESAVVEEALLAGLLHDVGKLILVDNLPEEYGKALRLSREQQIPLCDAERELIGSTHAEIGAYLLSLWSFQNEVVEAVAYHHNPLKSNVSSPSLLATIHIADALIDEAVDPSAMDRESSESTDGICAEFVEQLGIADNLPTYRAMVQQNLFVETGV